MCAVMFESMMIWISARPFVLPPPLPRSAMVVMPCSFAMLIALMIDWLLPLVEIARSTSSFLPSPQICRAKTSS